MRKRIPSPAGLLPASHLEFQPVTYIEGYEHIYRQKTPGPGYSEGNDRLLHDHCEQPRAGGNSILAAGTCSLAWVHTDRPSLPDLPVRRGKCHGLYTPQDAGAGQRRLPVESHVPYPRHLPPWIPDVLVPICPPGGRWGMVPRAYQPYPNPGCTAAHRPLLWHRSSAHPVPARMPASTHRHAPAVGILGSAGLGETIP